MNVRIHANPAEGTVEVYAFDNETEDRSYYTIGEDGWLMGHRFNRGELMEPLMRLPSDSWLLKALAAAALDIMPVEHATQAHLKDVITVRDRLLTIIEREPK